MNQQCALNGFWRDEFFFKKDVAQQFVRELGFLKIQALAEVGVTNHAEIDEDFSQALVAYYGEVLDRELKIHQVMETRAADPTRET